MSQVRTSKTANTANSADWRGWLRRPSVLVALGLLLALALVWGITLVRAAQPKSLDARTHEVASQLQCPICNGESVADSPSGLASEMRALIRQKLAQGESEQQVIQYFEARYGDTILEQPPVQGFTLMIWLPPVLMLGLGAYVIFVLGREWSATPALATTEQEDEPLDLSDEERRRLRETLLREMEQDEGMSYGALDLRKGHV
ncbi:MAG TPA: cytochrome c-type biogenesis protein [Ktedonobacterales bacterium]|jgi:cytochrome c-type biogenesis protein CcmH|nr:cytochrome c-type biogenesis protein [Ktedonobacterales bacterium]